MTYNLPDLPSDIDASYPDRSPGDTAHQQHHDAIHAALAGINAAGGAATGDDFTGPLLDSSVAALVGGTGETGTALDGRYGAAAARAANGVKPPVPSKVVTTFAAGHGFTNLNAASLIDDTATYAFGSQSIAVATPADGTPGSVQRTNLPPFDATGKDLTVSFRIDDSTVLDELVIYATSDATMASYYQWTLQDAGLEAQRYAKSGEWVTLTLSFASAVTIGTPNRAALVMVRLRQSATSTSQTTVRWNRIGLVPAPSAGVVSICVDDIYSSMVTQTRPILDKYGFAATCYAIPERATDAIVPVSTLHRLEDVTGWEIAAHGSVDLTTMALADAEKDVIASRKWLQGNGFRGVDHYAYPGGGYNPSVEAFIRRYYRSARTINSRIPHETQPPANPYRLRARSVSNATTVATVTAEITAAKNQNAWYILTFHDIIASGTPGTTQYLAADLDSICAQIQSQGLAVRTVGDVLAGM